MRKNEIFFYDRNDSHIHNIIVKSNQIRKIDCNDNDYITGEFVSKRPLNAYKLECILFAKDWVKVTKHKVIHNKLRHFDTTDNKFKALFLVHKNLHKTEPQTEIKR